MEKKSRTRQMSAALSMAREGVMDLWLQFGDGEMTKWEVKSRIAQVLHETEERIGAIVAGTMDDAYNSKGVTGDGRLKK